MENDSHVILIIEDSDEDFYTTQRALKKSGLANNIYRCSDGEEALDYLYRKNQYTDPNNSPHPNLILLDLNLPRKDGREVLSIIKNDSELRRIPVVVLTTSSDPRDIEKCYAANANSYVQKPVDLNGLMESIQRLKNYWFEIVILPKDFK